MTESGPHASRRHPVAVLLVLVALALAGCGARLTEPGRPATRSEGAVVPPIDVSSPDAAMRPALSTALIGTWQRRDADVYNVYTPDGEYVIDNRETGTTITGAITYSVVEPNRVRFDMADGGSVILDVQMPDRDTLIFHYPKTPYTEPDLVVFERIASLPDAPVEELPEMNVVFFDDFSDPNSGWPSSETETHAYGYQDGGYRIAVFSDNLLYHINAPEVELSDVSIEVDATRTGGTDREMSAAVLCRVTANPTKFYVFEVTFDGYYTIAKYVDGRPITLGIGYESSRAINRGDATNHIRADCIGNRLTLYVNGTRLAIVEDDALESGRVALAAATFQDKPAAEVLFDNLLVTAP